MLSRMKALRFRFRHPAVLRALHTSRKCQFDVRTTETRGPSGSLFIHVHLSSAKNVIIADSDSMKNLTAILKSLEPKLPKALFLRSAISGADIREMASIKTPSQAKLFIRVVDHLCGAIKDFRAPVVAVIESACFGAGMEVAACCDFRIATETARFGMPETKLGIPSVVQASLIPDLVGWTRARELLYLGDHITAREAYKWGFLNSVVEGSELRDTIKQWENRLDSVGPRALESQKALMRIWEEQGTGRAGIDASIEIFGNAFETSEPHVLMQKFFDAKKSR